jgi:hypothetical protein
MGKKKEKRIKPVQFIPIVLILILVFSSQPVVAGGEDALLGDAELTPIPGSQGEGGPITLDLAIPFYSGCCYPLYAYDVSASLTLPRNIKVISGPEPQKFSKVEAAAGGEPTWVHITWVVKSMIAGEYSIDVTVDTQNCGSTQSSASVTVTEGCVMSIPEVYPEKPSTEKDVYVNIEAMSPMEGVFIDDAVLYYTTFDNEKKASNPKNETMFFGEDKSIEGTPIAMEPMEGRANFFTVRIPKQSSASYLHFWVVATDNLGKKTSSPAYALKVEDMDQANFVLNLAVWSPFIITIMGIIIMILLSKHFKKVDEKEEGMLVLGSHRISQKDTSVDLKKIYQKRWNRTLYLGFGFLFSAGMILLVWGILSNQLGELVYVLGGGL